MKTTAFTLSLVLAVLMALSATPATARDRGCSLSLVPHVEGGHTCYEIVGSGFPAGATVRVEAMNTRIEYGQVFYVTAVGGRVSGIFIGKNDGQYSPVAPGPWEVSASAGSRQAK